MINRSEDLPSGTVKVTRHQPSRRDHETGQRWYLVEIGRGRYTKRFNISEDEATQLVTQLRGQVLHGIAREQT